MNSSYSHTPIPTKESLADESFREINSIASSLGAKVNLMVINDTIDNVNYNKINTLKKSLNQTLERLEAV